MDYEKKYKEALELARNVMQGKVGFVLDDVLEKFPELKESEDERIRKELIEQVIYIVPNSDEVDSEGNVLPTYQKRIDKYRAWLEKQGEHANFRNKIQVGDKVTRNEDGVLVNLSQLKRVAKPAEEYNITGIGSKNAQGKLGEMIQNLKPVNEVLEQKPWSEEDNRMCKAIIDNIQAICEEGYFVGNIDSNELIDWLKSIKERYTWRPSDEQMDALRYVTNFNYGGHKATLVSLYEQLKNLKG